ncbi:MAG: thrombospondin type 3 repeat-containing protein [Granulosicoccus sp.]
MGDACDPTDGNTNLAPNAESDAFVIVSVSGEQLLDVLANDNDPERTMLSISLDSLTSQLGVTLQIQDNKVLYRAPAGFSQQDSFGYKALDAEGLASGSVTVTVSPSDQDSDGVFDNADNCISSPNSDQIDKDGDGTGDLCDPTPLGESTTTEVTDEQLARGKLLVNKECVACHSIPSTGAPQFADDAAWSERLRSAGSIEKLVESAINGKGNLMPAFGRDYSATELTEAVLYLGGYATTGGVSPVAGAGLDADDDGIADTEDNCPKLPNEDQKDSDLNGVGDACEPEADADGDGYVFALDDDDGNARRLPGVALNIQDAVFFLSETDMALGDFARYLISASGNSSGGVLINDASFLQAAGALYSSVEPTLEQSFRKSLDIIDLEVRDIAGSSAEIIIQLFSTLPIRPQLSVYHPQEGQWTLFVADSVDQLASAQSIEGGCPASDSPNYTDGLGAGLRCIRVRLTDGGVNDSDGRNNGVVAFVATLGGSALNEPVGTVESVSSGSRSGGGTVGLIWIVVLLLFLLPTHLRNIHWSRGEIRC